MTTILLLKLNIKSISREKSMVGIIKRNLAKSSVQSKNKK